MATKKFFFPHGSFAIRDGSEIRFWEDIWLGQSTLREQYPALYTIVRNKNDTIAKVLGTSPPDVLLKFTWDETSILECVAHPTGFSPIVGRPRQISMESYEEW